MKHTRELVPRRLLLSTLVLFMGCASTRAEDIEISQYGVAPGGMPYAIALAKGWFQEEGADVTGIRGSPGGAPTIRNLLGGDLTYGEAGPDALTSANRSRARIRDHLRTVEQ